MKPYRQLRLYIDGAHITHRRFLKAVQAFFGLLKEVTAEVTGNPQAIDWIVSVRRGSIDLGVDGTSHKPSVPVEVVVNATYTGLKQLQSKSIRPAHFNDEALQEARDLAKLIDGKAVTDIQVRRSRNRFKMRGGAITHVDTILGGTVTELGAIEGYLEMISARGSLHFAVWDHLGDRRIRCFVRPEMEEKVMKAFRRRVSVHGSLRLRETGEPVSIDVEAIEVLPSDDQLPSADDVYGILAEIQ